MKLGELLVSDDILTAAQVEQALRAQVMWGGRLGTNLVELGFVDLDALSRALGRQHKLPAALARHFERSDRDLQRLLTPDIAERLACVPLMRAGEDKQDVVVAVISPLAAKPIALVADELACAPDRIIQSVAAELRIRYHLERVYNIPRGARFLRSRGPTVPAYPQFGVPPEEPEPPSAPDLAVPVVSEDVDVTMPVSMGTATVVSTKPVGDPAPQSHGPPVARATSESSGEVEVEIDLEMSGTTSVPVEPAAVEPARPQIERSASSSALRLAAVSAESLDDLSAYIVTDDEVPPATPAPVAAEDSGRDRRQYVRTLADMVDPAVPSGLDHKTLGRIAIRRVAVNAEPNAESSFPEATKAIRRATDRERVAELAMAAIDRYAPACEAAMLLIVRGEVAIGWKGFVRDDEPPPEFAVPLDQPNLVVSARKNATVRCSAADLDHIDQRLLEALGHDRGDLVVVPIVITGQVVCMIAIATASDASVAAVEAIAAATGAAFARLLLAAGR